jgi:signal transduction histidine kinase
MIEDGEVEGEEVRESARIIVEQTRKMTTIIRRLLDFARRGEASRRRQDVAAPVARAAGLLDSMARKAGLTLHVAPAEPLEADIDESQIEQVITNLVVNAIHATPSGGTVDVDVARAEAPPPAGGTPRPWAVVRVADSGRGMDDATRARIFEPFFTTKEVGEGTGLGLSVVWGIVADHGGFIDVASAPDAGATFTVHLPL